MAASDYGDLFAKLEAEVRAKAEAAVSDLTKLQAKLAASNQLLQAKNDYLVEQVAAAETKLDQLQQTIDQQQQQQQSQLDSLTVEIDLAVSEFNDLKIDHEIDKQRFRDQLQILATEQATASATLADTEALIASREDQLDLLQADRRELLASITTVKTTLADLEDELVAARSQTQSDVTALQATITDQQQKLYALQDKVAETEDIRLQLERQVATSTAELAAHQAKYDAFKHDEQMSRKALDSREQALLAREAELEIKTATARRRHTVIG